MIAESRLVWQKFDDEMKQLESRSFSRIGSGHDKFEQVSNITNNTTAAEKDVPVIAEKEAEKHKNEKENEYCYLLK